MMRCFALLIALLLPTLVRAAEFAELYSFSAMVIGLSPPPALSPQCDGGDKWIDIKTELTGNGVFPKTPSIIVGTQLWAFFSNPRAYLMIGQTQPNGDAITPFVFGTSTPPPVFFPAGHGFAFDPDRDHLRLHYRCFPDDPLPQFGFTIFYKKAE